MSDDDDDGDDDGDDDKAHEIRQAAVKLKNSLKILR